MNEFRAAAERLNEVMESVEARRGERAASTLRCLIPIWSVLAAMSDLVECGVVGLPHDEQRTLLRALRVAGEAGEQIAADVGLEDADMKSARLAILSDINDAITKLRKEE